MNKPKFEARGKKQNRGQGTTPDQELKDVLSQTSPPISEGLGISPEVLNTEGFSTAEVAERHYGIATSEHQADMGLTATAPFVGMDREWTAEEKAGMNDSLRRYGWKDQSPPLAATADDPKAIVNAAPGFKLGGQPFVPLGEPEDRYQGPGEDINKDVSSISPVEEVTEAQIVAGLNDTMSSGDAVIARLRALPSEGVTPKMLADVMLGNVTPADGAELREQYYEIHGGVPVVVQQAQPVNDAEEDPPMYYQEDLIIVIMRHRAKDPDEDRARMRRMLSAFVDRISGLNTGFKVIPAPGSNPAKLAKPQYEAASSTVKLDYTERKGKIFAKFFESWGVDISRFGLNDITTVDFFVIEPSKDGKTVLDAWNCTGMHPYYMGTVEADTYYGHKQLRQVTQFQVTLNGTVRRGTVEIEAAQGLLDDLNAQLAAGA